MIVPNALSSREGGAGVATWLLIAAVLLGGCGWFGGRADVDELGDVARSVLEEVDARPLEGEAFRVSVTEVKFDRPYVSVDGIRPREGPTEAIAAVSRALTDRGWRIVRQKEIDVNLGHETVATDGRLVVRALVGEGGDELAGYPPLDEGAYMAVLVANVDSGPAWSEVG